MFATPLLRLGYRHLAKPFFFRRDPEAVHDRVTALGERIAARPWLLGPVRAAFAFAHPSLETEVCGIRFANPVGLSAGFDKDARLIGLMPALGFGFTEVGSITGEPCAGNAKPRLWRLPVSRGLVVHYGLKNEGCEAIANRLRGKTLPLPVGTSIAKTNAACTVPLETGIADYAKAFRAFADIGAYFTINVSCPNAFGGEPFADPERLDALLAALDHIETRKPVFLKLGADLTTDALDALVRVADRHRVHGFVLANLTKDRTASSLDQLELSRTGPGGISGRPVADRSNALISHLYHTCGDRYAIVGVGGIFTADDAYEKIRCGASLVQLITGMIYEGPQLIGEINRGIAERLRRDGFGNVREAVGTGSTRA